jgi:TP901 family phage tail tape measure protein
MSVPLATMPEDLAKMAYQGGKLGIKAGKGMTGFLEVVSKIKAGFDMSATEAGTLVGDIKAKLGLGVAGIKKLMSQVNYLADNTSADGAKMINVIQRVSSEFSLMKFDTLEVAAFAGAASQIKVSAELAATGLQMAFTKLQQSPIYQQQFQKTPVKTFMTLLKSLRQMDAIARNTKIQKLFGVDAGKFIMGAVDKIGLFEEALTKVKDKKALKSLDKEFANFLKRSSTGFLQLKIKFTKIFIKIGDVFLRFFERNKAVINSAIDGVSEWIEANGNIIPIVLGIIAVVTVLGAAVLAFAAIMAVLNIAMGVFGTIVMIAFSPITLAILTIIGIAYILYKIISGITGKSITGIDKAVASAKRLQESQNNMQNVGFGKGINNSYKTEMMKKSDVNISGEIGVKADKGSQITRNRININQGSNFAVDFGHH